MKITICSSAYFAKEAYKIKKKLEEMGHKVFIYPKKVQLSEKVIEVEEYYKMRKEKLSEDVLDLKEKLLKEHLKRIEESDAILVLNFDKDGISGYVGGNTFLEMGVAYYLRKKIYLWKAPSEEIPYFEEIMTMKPIIINGDIGKIGNE